MVKVNKKMLETEVLKSCAKPALWARTLFRSSLIKFGRDRNETDSNRK